MSAVRLKLLPMLAFTKQHKTYVPLIRANNSPSQNVYAGPIHVHNAPAHALSDGNERRGRPGRL